MAVRLKRNLFALLACASFGGLLSASCAEDEAAFVIRQAQTVEEDTCIFTTDAETYLAQGRLDVGLRYSYDAGLLLENDLVPQKDDENLKSETARITVYEAEVTLEDSSGEIDSFEWPATGFLQADAPGFGVTAIPLVRAEVGQRLEAQLIGNPGARKELLATVIVRGRTTGGNELETPEWTFPITACWGCLVTFSQDTVDPEDGNLCTLAPQDVTTCNVGQDQYIACNECPTVAACQPPTP